MVPIRATSPWGPAIDGLCANAANRACFWVAPLVDRKSTHHQNDLTWGRCNSGTCMPVLHATRIMQIGGAGEVTDDWLPGAPAIARRSNHKTIASMSARDGGVVRWFNPKDVADSACDGCKGNQSGLGKLVILWTRWKHGRVQNERTEIAAPDAICGTVCGRK